VLSVYRKEWGAASGWACASICQFHPDYDKGVAK
jgi:hypothetical protein